MSHAFVREGDEQSLQDISPTVNSLVNFLTRDNNGIRVYLQKTYYNDAGHEVHVMSNGLQYVRFNDKWQLAQ
jgi:hypothetical protein